MKSLILSNCLKPVYFIAALLIFTTINPVSAQYPVGSPVAINGKLKVTGTQLTNECGNKIVKLVESKNKRTNVRSG